MDTYTILHYEDEPLTVDWLRESINLRLCKLYPDWATQDELNVVFWDGENRRTVYKVDVGNPSAFQLVYQICETLEQFSGALNGVSDFQHSVFVLDLMGQGSDHLELLGLECHDKIASRFPMANIFFLSGYVSHVPPKIEQKIGRDHLYSKPVNVNSFANAVLDELRLPNAG